MNRPGKILFVSHEATRTGAPMFLLHFLTWLRAETEQPFEILFDRGGPLLEEFAKIAPVHTRQQSAMSAAFFESFELIYANTCCNGLFLDNLPCGKTPILTHLHELDFAYDCLGARNMAAVVRHTNYYIACAEIVARRFARRFNIPGERIAVHYEMIDAARIATRNHGAKEDELRRELDLPKDAFIVAGCGSVDIRKGADLFVQLAGALQRTLSGPRPLRFVWIGKRGPGEFTLALAQDIRRLGMSEQIRFVGEMASPHDLLALADVFCLTSREDPFPLAMLEAAALGKPVVCFEQAGGGAEFCAFGGGRAVPFLDVAGMGAACRDLLEQPALATEIGARGQTLVRERFGVSAIAPKLWAEIERFRSGAVSFERPLLTSSLAEIFSTWASDETPQRGYITAHIGRQEVRAKARSLIARGKRGEAIQLLMQKATSDLGTRDPHIMIEALVEIGDDLAPLEPAKSAQLLSEGEKLARMGGLNLAAFRERKRSAAVPVA